MALPADEAVVGVLAAAGLQLTSGSNLFAGPVRPHGSGVPLKAVFCTATGGPANQPYLGTGKDWRVKTVQLVVRGAVGDFKGGQTLARGCLAALHRAQLDGYTYCLVRESQPEYAGENGAGAHLWSINVELGLVE